MNDHATNSDRAADVALDLFSQPRLLAPARALTASFAQRVGFNEVQCGQISLAVDEALCNIINHGYDRRPDGRIRVSMWELGGDAPGIRILVEDRAKQVDPTTIRSRDLDDIRPGGLGVFIIREIMDSVEYALRDGGGMSLWMVKRVPQESATAACTPAPGREEGKHR
jgi:anti-sigma regulatory factor (Ser/Thr protein kinase)